METCADLSPAWLQCVNNCACRRERLSLRGLSFIDSSGIRALMEGHYLATEQGKGLWVVDWTPGIWRVFNLLDLADVLERDPDESQ